MATRRKTPRRRSKRSPAQRKRDLEELKKVKPQRGLGKETGVDVAEDALLKAQEDLERWEHQARQYALELNEVEQSLGERVVGGVASGKQINRANTKSAVEDVADHIASLRVKKEAADGAAEVARKKVDQAQRAVWLAQADEKRTEAQRLRAKATERRKKTDPLLQQLLEFEGVPYVPKPPEGHSVVNANQAPAGVGAPVTYVPISKTQAIIDQASELDRQAHALEERAANTPEARAEAAERLRKSRAETFAHTNAEHQRKREEDHEIRKRNQQEREKARKRKAQATSVITRGTPFDAREELDA